MASHRPTNRERSPPPIHAEVAFERAVLAAALDPIVTINPEGTILSASDSIERVFGWTVADLVGRNVRVLMPEPHRSAHDGYLATYAATGRTGIMGRPRQFEAVRRDGVRFPIELCVSRADIPGRPDPVFVGIIRDLSEQKQVEAELARHRERLERLVAERTEELDASHEQLQTADRMASIGTLAAGLGHDMNNVLLPVRARLNALRAEGGSLSASASNHLDEIRRSIAYLQQLADGLHYLVMDPQCEGQSRDSTDLSAWWAQVGALLSKSVPKHVNLVADIPRDLPPVAVAAHRLTQALLNLIVNAGEAIPADGQRREGRVRVTAAPDRRAPDLVRLTVADNGVGMSEEVKRRAADIFFTTKPRGLGTGLGLALVNNVAAGAGGRLEIKSKPGKGTTISLVLPAPIDPNRDGPPRRAAITVSDGRAAAMLHHVLDICGIRIVASPEDADAWITDPLATGPEQARAWIAARPGAPLILLGHPGAAWEGLDSVTVVPSDDINAIRAAIGDALAS